jgi:hypothetical protein
MDLKTVPTAPSMISKANCHEIVGDQQVVAFCLKRFPTGFAVRGVIHRLSRNRPHSSLGGASLAPWGGASRSLHLRTRATARINAVDINIIFFIEIFLLLIKAIFMIPSYWVYGANRLSQPPSLLSPDRIRIPIAQSAEKS